MSAFVLPHGGNDTTVFSNGHGNALIGGSGMNWYLGNLATDQVFLVFGEDVITAIHKKQYGDKENRA